MGFTTAIRIALIALRRNLLRTMLTMLGMIIGVAAVIAIVALGRGAQDAIEASIKAAGTNMIIVTAGNWTQGGVRLGMGASSKLTDGDADALRAQVAGAQYVAAGLSTHKQVIVDGQNWSTSIDGTDVDLPKIRNWPMRCCCARIRCIRPASPRSYVQGIFQICVRARSLSTARTIRSGRSMKCAKPSL